MKTDMSLNVRITGEFVSFNCFPQGEQVLIKIDSVESLHTYPSKASSVVEIKLRSGNRYLVEGLLEDVSAKIGIDVKKDDC